MNEPDTTRAEPLIGAVNALVLPCDDLEAAKRFYCDVIGFDVLYEDPGDVCGFRAGDTFLHLVQSKPANTDPGMCSGPQNGTGFFLSVWVDDVDAIAEQLTSRGATLTSPPIDRPWGKRNFTVADPAGHVWEFAGPPTGDAG